ncbi:response regulator [Phaeobacter gallaeciensis]|uniref:response regulator n=1 Tax=Phaeobacter gallaeciensis TaxID=60890 RepID=UPI0023807CF7|nr:response regulator [Phaeobacter gallaeciensis]MDE4276806.1 response regulator [Phaeobacter gallaeciensis]MDE4302040.1 response regulator [Phaeobacter gallaeciensis]MDE5187230.1 response regulator [Phaeobacter gallaeciensis]
MSKMAAKDTSSAMVFLEEELGLPWLPNEECVLKVLTLDDDKLDRLRLIRTAKKAGLKFNFDEASSLGELNACLDSSAYDVIFIDHKLGLDNGIDALRMILAHEEQVNAIPIMVTSATMHSIAIEAMRMGCADYLVKEELTVSSLAKSVAAAVERRVVFAQIANAKALDRELKGVVSRFLNTCGPEMRVILTSTIKTLRGLKAINRNSNEIDPVILSNFTVLERGCFDLTRFVDDLESVVHRIR